MRVKCIIIDGFKSYAHRKALEDLSPHFNAITGLNGSGKSNIFDAICFVMGITNLKRVRAEDPRELIFRAGTTGVHAARVTIEFYNDDPKTAPPGYNCDDFPLITIGRQIKIGGKQQFFFNNTVSMQSKVKRFFESISLNVDNPHFMVLQGTVHKLIGMQSRDILAMLEEAVGTRAFDHRRRTAENLIRSKERKMQEIDANLETQIGPMLQAMKVDHDEYARYLRLNEGMEAKRRFHVAFDYWSKRRSRDALQQQWEGIKAKAEVSRQQLLELPGLEEDARDRQEQIQLDIKVPTETGVTLHEQLGEQKRQLARFHGSALSTEKSIKEFTKVLKGIADEEQKHRQRVEQCSTRKDARAELLGRIAAKKEALVNLKNALQLQQSGIQASASGVSLEEERGTVEREMVHLQGALKRLEEREAELHRELEQAQRQGDHDAQAFSALNAEVQQTSSRMQELEARYAPYAPLEQRLQQVQQTLSSARDQYHQMNEAVSRESGGRHFDLQFQRGPGSPDLEADILGRVGTLIRPKDPQHSVALSVGAAMHLLRVCVTRDDVAEAIIKRNLRQRTSFFPLNKLQAARLIPEEKLREAQILAEHHGGFVGLAKDLVTCSDPRVAPLCDFVFGQFLVCSDIKLAQELAYSPKVRVKAVTLEGDMAEPNGTMSGGATQGLRDFFVELQAHEERQGPLRALRHAVATHDADVRSIQQQMSQGADVIRQYRAVEDAFTVAQQRLALLRSSEGNRTAQLEAAVQTLTEEKAQLETQLQATATKRRAIQQQLQLQKDPETQRKALADQLAVTTKELKELQQQEEREATSYEKFVIETEQQTAALAAKRTESEEEVASRVSELTALKQKIAVAEEEHANLQRQCEETEAARARMDKELDDLAASLQRLAERRQMLENNVKSADLELKSLQKAMDEQRKGLQEDERRYTWLAGEVHRFGDPTGPFYFEDRERTEQTLQELREAEAQSHSIGRRVNKKATVLYEDRQREYEQLVKQRANLAEDRTAIEQCICGIEAKKWLALDRMVGIVSKIFSALFSTCLPGATAELREERDASQHLVGLQVKVSFHGKEKESLTELSGGQRSLLALCLILAILRVKQAPVYILDEVDAALDPSHTQNIGKMLQQHFSDSQFLLVSLKDGMYSNADVLYQVRNTQGYSEIARVVSKATH